MGIANWLSNQAEQGRKNRIAKLEHEVRVEEAKAGKTFRRSSKHLKDADKLQAKAEKLRGSS